MSDVETPPPSASDAIPDSAIRLAGAGHATIPKARAWDLHRHLDDLEEDFRAIYPRLTADAAAAGEPAESEGAQRLLDNDYVVQEALEGVREGIPPEFYRQLPVIRSEAARLEARVYVLARGLAGAGQKPLDLDWAELFVTAYQRSRPLTIRELWALPALLRLVLLETLAREARSLVEAGLGESPDPATSDQGNRGAVIGGLIGSLRNLAGHDWKGFFERTSRVEQILRQDPVHAYPRLDFATRDRYRKAAEEIAKWAERDEDEVARRAIGLCGEHEDGCRRRHVGYYLIDEGRERLERMLPCRLPWRVRARRFLERHATAAYLASVGVLALLGASGMASLAPPEASAAERAILFVLSILPASSLAVGFIQWALTRELLPRLLPKLDFEKGIPSEHRSVVVIPVIFSSHEASSSWVESLIESLEINYLGNADPHLHFALLSDFADAPRQHMPGDDATLETVVEGVRRLNERYGDRGEGSGPFSLFHRRRLWNETADRYMGWERKRGKLHELNRLFLGAEDTTFDVRIGDLGILRSSRYVITLDADTVMPPGTARRLVGTLAHPLNRPELDPEGRVVAGYTILQPRMETRPSSAGKSRFSRIFAGDTGLDLYTHAVSDFYQDLFGEGNYAGKGIYDIEAFASSLAGRAPENALLSHDLFEGLHARVALVSDIELFEDYPASFLAYTRRLHRWVRGDWQLLPWLARRVPRTAGARAPSRFRLLDLWKIFDNLRRSLILPALFFLLVASWFGRLGGAWAATGVLMAVLGAPILFAALSRVDRAAREGVKAALSGPFGGVRFELQRWLLTIAFLPYESYVIMDAICRTLVRLTLTRKRLLEWTSAAQTSRLLDRSSLSLSVWRQMWPAPASAVVCTAALAAGRPAALWVAGPMLLSWLLSPQLAHWISKPLHARRPALSAQERSRLRRVARRTWFFFEQFVGAADHFLPPDNYQEDPGAIVARRTSPTNIGLSLLSTLGAFDLGYLGAREMVVRLQNTFDTLDQLQRHRGHFLNWYETRRLQPLEPRYVSTVDSGNLAGCLLALRQGLEEAARTPVPGPPQRQGLSDTLEVLAELLVSLHLERRRDPSRATLASKVAETRDPVAGGTSWAELVDELWARHLPELEKLFVRRVESEPSDMTAAGIHGLRQWLERFRHQTAAARHEIAELTPWLPLIGRRPRLYGNDAAGPALDDAFHQLLEVLPESLPLDEVASACGKAGEWVNRLDALLLDAAHPEELAREARAWNAELADALTRARRGARELLADLRELAQRAEAFFEAMDFGFLYDRERHLFRIGYDLSAGAVDLNYYDLFASEARIASFVAIAKGDVPPKHWLHLGRPMTRFAGRRVLVSWGATLFEYLMPDLLMRHPERTLMTTSCRTAVAAHVRFAARHGIPWGISESGYHRLDRHSNYQYRTFGVPGIGLRRASGDRLVVAPYASLLALPVDPPAVLENLDRLEELRMLGSYGFFEAVDFGLTADPPPRRPKIVRSYMSHHQGMALVTLDNVLNGDAWVRRFHRDRRITSVCYLLYERAPRGLAPAQLRREDVPAAKPQRKSAAIESWTVQPRAPRPQVLLLSNGRYSVLLTAAAGGKSAWNGKELTRWREDQTLEAWGQWLYLKDLDSGELWSAGLEPAGGEATECEVTFAPHMAELHRRHHEVTSILRIAVSPHDDLEVRSVRLTNDSARPRRLLVMSGAEVAMAAAADDVRHPAFNKLVVESRFLEESGILLFRRRPREADEKLLFLAHAMVTGKANESDVLWETDRASFLGRGGDARAPRALTQRPVVFSGRQGATLDPMMALGLELVVPARGATHIAFLTTAGSDRSEVLARIASYRSLVRVDWTFDQAHRASERELQLLAIAPSTAQATQLLLSAVLSPHVCLRADREILAACTRAQSGLWSQGISGDLPILLVRIGAGESLDLVEQVLRAHTFWRNRRLGVDLVLLDEEAAGYAQPTRQKLDRLAEQMRSRSRGDLPGRIAIVAAAQLRQFDRSALLAAARVVLDSRKGSLMAQLETVRGAAPELPAFVPLRVSPLPSVPVPELARPANLLFDNGLGGFSAQTGDYVLHLEPGRRPPAPWINVISNASFGCLISESGASTTWGSHSGELRLTPWHNDPVTDESGEALYLRDEETAEIWSPTPAPAPAPAPYQVRHAPGHTVFRHHSHGLEQELEVFVDRDDPVKVIALDVRNAGLQPRQLTVTCYAEWVLGTARSATAPFVVPDYDIETGALLARNAFSRAADAGVAFLAASQAPHAVTADRSEFLGRGGSLKRPAGLRRFGLSGKVEPGLDPCAAYQLHIALAAGETRHLHFLLGQGRSRDQALRLVERFRTRRAVEASRRRVVELWQDLLGHLMVKTPEPAMDLLLNKWLLYQTVSCRLWGRTALFQSSGAFGFRDQLQDVMALVHAAPQLARRHLLEAARHQFEQGDVLHWWHPPAANGVRTRCSDDLLWLPLSTTHYVEATGDTAILEEEVPFLHAEPLARDETVRYAEYEPGRETATLYEHCCRAIDAATTEGPRGLPLIGSCDWNDGFNRVGRAGRGESVWLGWFLCTVWRRFAALCERLNDPPRAERYRRQASALARRIEEQAWDGAWYRRAYYDDGTPLGSSSKDECQIDLIAQAWAVLSGAAQTDRASRAMESAFRRLVREEPRLLLLLAPPFDRTAQDPGYIKAYPPGVRENGGQYTHASVWGAWALAELGDRNRAAALWRLLNPILRTATPEGVETYRVEPYVVAADVYGVEPHTGRGGWTWYTGAAGWLYRFGVEAILGIRRRGRTLRIRPLVPADWPGFEATWREGKSTYHIRVESSGSGARGATEIELDGRRLSGREIPLVDDGGRHEVRVVSGNSDM